MCNEVVYNSNFVILVIRLWFKVDNCFTIICLTLALYTIYYHIFCCNIFAFACLVIARSQCWLFALKYSYLPANISTCLRIQLSVFAQWSQRLCVKAQGKICIRSYFNQINRVKNIGIKFK